MSDKSRELEVKDQEEAIDLKKIKSPSDLKKLDISNLPILANQIRKELIHSVAKTGGHLGPNLGTVELSIALHYVFNSPKDKFTFDVSHQAYTHKILTGRYEKIDSIRQFKGLCGFTLRTESEHDSYGAGHAGTAVSAALGMASARDLNKSDEHIVAVAGDAAFTCGPTFEALNNIKNTTNKFIIVLNDNEWSIDKNVGAIADYFNKISTSITFSHIRDRAANFVEKVMGKGVREFVGKVEESAKHLIVPSVLFEEFGLRYYGPIDGHDVDLLIKTFELLKDVEVPVILHIITKKGKGYRPALEQPMKFHGLGKYKIDTGETAKANLPTYSEIFAKTLVKIAKDDEKVTALTAAMPGGTGLSLFQKEIPERYYDVGIAEEHAAIFACGQSIMGYKPFLTIYSTFLQRAYDMLIHDIALQNLPVRICMDRAGLSGDDGPTHHGLFDIAYLGSIPNIIHMQPKDEEEFADMLFTMADYEKGPIAIRYPRGVGRGSSPKETLKLLKIGEAEVIEDGDDIALISLGNMIDLAEEVKIKLEKDGISCALINARWIQPFDEKLIVSMANKCKLICTFEDAYVKKGFGESIVNFLNFKEELNSDKISKVINIGWPQEFIEHGSIDELREKHGLTVGNSLKKIKSALEKVSISVC